MKTHIFIFVALLISLLSCSPPAPIPTAIPMPSLTSPTVSPTVTETPEPLIATPLPTQPPIVFAITPDTIQVTNWKEYQTELARCVLAQVKCDYPGPEAALCEWDILGRSGQEVYVWAECAGSQFWSRKPLIIYLQTDGSIKEVKFGGYKGSNVNLELFPKNVQEKIHAYFDDDSLQIGIPEALRLHLLYRETHRGEPPLIILSATRAP